MLSVSSLVKLCSSSITATPLPISCIVFFVFILVRFCSIRVIPIATANAGKIINIMFIPMYAKTNVIGIVTAAHQFFSFLTTMIKDNTTSVIIAAIPASIPCMIASNISLPRIRSYTFEIIVNITSGGIIVPNKHAIAPINPHSLNPSSNDVFTAIGPGEDCASVIMSIISCSVNIFFFSTYFFRIIDMITKPPPNVKALMNSEFINNIPVFFNFSISLLLQLVFVSFFVAFNFSLSILLRCCCFVFCRV